MLSPVYTERDTDFFWNQASPGRNSRSLTLGALALAVYVIVPTPSTTLLHRNTTSEGFQFCSVRTTLKRPYQLWHCHQEAWKLAREGNAAGLWDDPLSWWRYQWVTLSWNSQYIPIPEANCEALGKERHLILRKALESMSPSFPNTWVNSVSDPWGGLTRYCDTRDALTSLLLLVKKATIYP